MSRRGQTHCPYTSPQYLSPRPSPSSSLSPPQNATSIGCCNIKEEFYLCFFRSIREICLSSLTSLPLEAPKLSPSLQVLMQQGDTPQTQCLESYHTISQKMLILSY